MGQSRGDKSRADKPHADRPRDDGMRRRPSDGPRGEVYFEFIAIGNAMRVTAVDAVTGVEVVTMGPLGAAQADLERLALMKLRRRLEAG